MMWIVFAIILFLVVLVLLYDYAGTVFTWLSRIGIGSFTDSESWRNSTESVIKKWMSSGTPKVPLDDRKRMKLFYQIRNIKKVDSTAYWQDAAVVKAASKLTGDEVEGGFEKIITRYIDEYSGDWKTEPKRVDCAMLAYEFLTSPYIDNNAIEPAMHHVADYLKNLYQRFGSIPYNEDIPQVRFVDTIGMVCPFLIKYASVYERPEFVDIAMNQIKEYGRFGIHEELKIPVHCFDVNNNAPMGIYGWGRGCAWWIVGLTDSLKTMLECGGRNADKVLLLNTSLSFLKEINKYIGDDGSIGRNVFISSLQDSSAAAMIAYCYKFFASLTSDDELNNKANLILEHLVGCTRKNGVIDFSQGDTRSIGFYADNLTVIPAAQGFAVAANRI